MSAAAISLYFERPAAEIIAALDQLANESTRVMVDDSWPASSRERVWLYDGMAFKLAVTPARSPHPGIQTVFFETGRRSFVTALNIAFNHQLNDGLRVPALAKGYLEFCALLAAELAAAAVGVEHADILCGRDYFVEAVGTYVSGGPFPALALISFKTVENGDELFTSGLAVFSGQELHLVAPQLPNHEKMRRMVRLVHDVAAGGPIQRFTVVADIDPDASIELEPNLEGGIVLATLRFGPE